MNFSTFSMTNNDKRAMTQNIKFWFFFLKVHEDELLNITTTTLILIANEISGLGLHKFLTYTQTHPQKMFATFFSRSRF